MNTNGTPPELKKITIGTKIPDKGLCYVVIDDLELSVEDAMGLGLQICAAANRAYALNALNITLLGDGAGPVESVSLMKMYIKNLSGLK